MKFKILGINLKKKFTSSIRRLSKRISFDKNKLTEIMKQEENLISVYF